MTRLTGDDDPLVTEIEWGEGGEFKVVVTADVLSPISNEDRAEIKRLCHERAEMVVGIVKRQVDDLAARIRDVGES